jgi:hypothetical protein
MKKTLAVLSLLIALVPLTEVQGNSGWKPTISVCSGLATSYTNDSNMVYYVSPVFQTDLLISFKNGLFTELWNSVPSHEDYDQNFGTEQDVGFGWKGPLSAIGLNRTVLDAGTAYCNKPKTMVFGWGDMVNIHVDLSQTIGNLTLSSRYDNYVVMPNSGGNFISASVKYSKMLKSSKLFKHKTEDPEGIIVNLSLAPTYNTSDSFGYKDAVFLRGILELDGLLTEHLMVILQFKHYKPIMLHDDDIRNNDSDVGYMGFSYQF